MIDHGRDGETLVLGLILRRYVIDLCYHYFLKNFNIALKEISLLSRVGYC